MRPKPGNVIAATIFMIIRKADRPQSTSKSPYIVSGRSPTNDPEPLT